MKRSHLIRASIGLVISVVSIIYAGNIWEPVPFTMPAGITPMPRRIEFDAAGNLLLTHVHAGYFRLQYPYVGKSWQCLNGDLPYDTIYKSYHGWGIYEQPQTKYLFASQPAFGKSKANSFRSTDGGAHWLKMVGYCNNNGSSGTFPTSGRVGFFPDGSICFGSYSAPPRTSGVYRSNDSGKTCKLLPGNNSGSVLTLGFNKVTGDCWACGADSDYANLCMLQVSHDTGKTWINVLTPTQMPTTDEFRDIATVVFDSAGNSIFMTEFGIFRTKDRGASFQKLSKSGNGSSGGYFGTVIIDPYGWFFATNANLWNKNPNISMSKSNGDSGTWVPFNSGLPDTLAFNSIVFNPIDGRLYCSRRDSLTGNYGMLYRTVNPIHPPTSTQLFNNIVPNNTFRNPYAYGSNIFYSVQEKGHVVLNIYGLNGNLVKQLVNKEMNTGTYNIGWNRMNGFGNEMPSGIYFIQLKNGNSKTTKAIPITK